MNNHVFNVAAEIGTDLSSRWRASKVRDHIYEITDAHAQVFVLNFQDVRSISHSFADELFAIIVVERGIDWFRENIHLSNLSESNREAILETIQSRLSNGPALSAGA